MLFYFLVFLSLTYSRTNLGGKNPKKNITEPNVRAIRETHIVIMDNGKKPSIFAPEKNNRNAIQIKSPFNRTSGSVASLDC